MAQPQGAERPLVARLTPALVGLCFPEGSCPEGG